MIKARLGIAHSVEKNQKLFLQRNRDSETVCPKEIVQNRKIDKLYS